MTEEFLDRFFWSLLTGISILPAFQGITRARKDRIRGSKGRAGDVSRVPLRLDQSRVPSGGWWRHRAPSLERQEASKEGKVSVTAALPVPVGSRKTPERQSPGSAAEGRDSLSIHCDR